MVMEANNASPHVIWQVIRKNSAFIRRQHGINKHFSVERGNLRKMNSARDSGLVNKKTVDVQTSQDGKSVVVTLKKKCAAANPTKGQQQIVMQMSKGNRPIINAVKGCVGAYKPAHQHLAAKRTSQLLRTAKPVKAHKNRKAD